MAKKLRTRKHAVVLNRSVGGDVGITVYLDLRCIHVSSRCYMSNARMAAYLTELWMFLRVFTS